MAISRASKAKKVQMLTKELESSTSAIVGTFTGLTASKDFDLRKTIRAAGGSYHVVKNKLAAKASEGSKIEAALQGLKGVSAVAYTAGDPVQLAKALSTWVKDNAEFTFKLAIVDGKVLSVPEIGDLASLPGKEELCSKLLFLISSPAQRLVTVMNATGRDLAVVINQAVEKEKFSASAAVATVQAEPTASSLGEESGEQLVAAAHAEEAPTPAEQIAVNPASEADAVGAEGGLQPENGTASQAGEAANSEPAEG